VRSSYTIINQGFLLLVSLFAPVKLLLNQRCFKDDSKGLPGELHQAPHVFDLILNLFNVLEKLRSLQGIVVLATGSLFELCLNLKLQVREVLLELPVLDVEGLVDVGSLQVQGLIKHVKLLLHKIHVLVDLLRKLLNGFVYKWLHHFMHVFLVVLKELFEFLAEYVIRDA